MKTLEIFLTTIALLFVGLLFTSQVGDVGTPRIQYFTFQKCDATATDTTPIIMQVCRYMQRGVYETETRYFSADATQIITPQGNVIDCPSAGGGTTVVENDSLFCPWQTVGGQAWNLGNNSNYWQRQNCS